MYSAFVNADGWMAVPDYVIKDVKSCKVRNMNMIEELGDISYLFCDKTGTLT
jgi:P-type E1-E2 ATPase